ncbi:hypothetical protein LNKW23_31680 [Paralimibaculum aggregatum]|uniref:Uncharacterized protein n=1 Tax=Paralimibaculum aggregatum TaxID=3036245 RepID=A0ABQ6LRF9_9RHOB|nr:hypothetical protein LNKW23_31680 [Limibaculum sp. NKW23]
MAAKGSPPPDPRRRPALRAARERRRGQGPPVDPAPSGAATTAPGGRRCPLRRTAGAGARADPIESNGSPPAGPVPVRPVFRRRRAAGMSKTLPVDPRIRFLAAEEGGT